MRRFVALLLLVLLPLQAVWAAAAPYCQHEGDAASHHIGHHQPEHAHAHAHTTVAEASQDDAHGAPGEPATPGEGAASAHSDCHVCHGGTVLAQEVRMLQVAAASAQPVPTLVHGLPAPPAERPDRPSWLALA